MEGLDLGMHLLYFFLCVVLWFSKSYFQGFWSFRHGDPISALVFTYGLAIFNSVFHT